MFVLLVPFIFSVEVQGFCGDNFKWSHRFNLEDVYGMWYGVAYAQHTPDMTNKPNRIGCITLYIADATYDSQVDWNDWSIPRRMNSDPNWLSYRNNPWSDTPLSGSWLDTALKRYKKDLAQERKLRVIWDEDGQSMEQTYLYTTEDPGLWTVERWQSRQQDMLSRGIEVWNPEAPPYHPEVIKVLKLTPEMLIINHCSDQGVRGVFSLILRRSYNPITREEWYSMQDQFYEFDIPTLYRFSAVCGCYGNFAYKSVVFISLMLCYYLN